MAYSVDKNIWDSIDMDESIGFSSDELLCMYFYSKLNFLLNFPSPLSHHLALLALLAPCTYPCAICNCAVKARTVKYGTSALPCSWTSL
jgi:hypothetical protein